MNAYGQVTINGKTYVEREQTFSMIVTPANGNTIRTNLPLPGTADFWLKCLTRDTIVAGASTARRFLFRLGNSDGSTWYQCAGNGGTVDKVIDTLLFGSGQFPFVLCPYIFFSASGSIQMEIQDISTAFDYSIYFGFRGSYLLPV